MVRSLAFAELEPEPPLIDDPVTQTEVKKRCVQKMPVARRVLAQGNDNTECNMCVFFVIAGVFTIGVLDALATRK